MFNCEFLEETTSTNAVLMSMMREKYARGEVFSEISALRSDFQTQGRGAGTNKWFSSKGKNILLSVCVKPNLQAADQFLFNLYFSVATHRFLSKYLPNVKIKWPNDMYVGDKKLAGDLTQHVISNNKIDFTIAGIGINVNEETFPADIPNPTSLLLEARKQFSVPQLVDEYLQILENELNTLDVENELNLRDRYKSVLYKIDEPHSYLVDNQIVEGIIRDIDHYGRLLLEHTSTGQLKAYEYKQIVYLFDC